MHLFILVGLKSFLFPAVIVSHGDNGQDDVDQVERSHEDDDHEEKHLILTVRLDRLQQTRQSTRHVAVIDTVCQSITSEMGQQVWNSHAGHVSLSTRNPLTHD